MAKKRTKRVVVPVFARTTAQKKKYAGKKTLPYNALTKGQKAYRKKK